METGRRGLLVAAANESAQALGVTVGLAFTDACARAPNLLHEEIDRQADHLALRGLADWMVRFSPAIMLDGRDALLMEVTGCAHLFDGEAGMVEEIKTRLHKSAHTAHLAVANTPGAASAFARSSPQIVPDDETRARLSELPVEGLRLSYEAVELLRRFGLTRIGQLYGVDRKALARRFASRETADAVVMRLDQALGLRHEPMTPLRPAPEWRVRLACPEPIASSEGIVFGLNKLVSDLCAKLDEHGVGARDFSFMAFRADGGVSDIHVSAARPVRDPKHILRLFSERIDRIDPGFGVDLLLLGAARAETLGQHIAPLSAEMAAPEEDGAGLARLADRLAARLGTNAVQVARCAESHIPERAEQLVPYNGDVPALLPEHKAGPRPLRLLDRPEQIETLAEVPDGPPLLFTWRRVTRRVARADGPERLAPEWWKLSERRSRARDYYRVEDETGRRYWLYRDGLYDDNRGGPPRWFLHGIFA